MTCRLGQTLKKQQSFQFPELIKETRFSICFATANRNTNEKTQKRKWGTNTSFHPTPTRFNQKAVHKSDVESREDLVRANQLSSNSSKLL